MALGTFDSGIYLPVFPSRTNLKLHNISVTPKIVKKVIMNLDLSKASGCNCIPVVVLKNCEPELSYILSVLEEKSSFKMLALTFSSKLDWGSYITVFLTHVGIQQMPT